MELALARRGREDAEAAVERLREQRAAVERAVAAMSGESVGDVMTLRLLLEQLDRALHNACALGALASATEAEKHDKYVEARNRREAMERLVSVRAQRVQSLERLVEQSGEDEAALVTFRSRGRRDP